LVRWQTQEAEGAQLRDQVRQAAQLWEERSRSDDMLWTGTAFREFELWRERYPGGLTATEEAYAKAMVDKSERQRRRRRHVAVAAFLLLLGTLGVVGALWQRSETALDVASAEARRAEASKLLAIGQVRVGENRSEAVAYAIASLELVDDPEVRRFVLETLWRGPTAILLPTQDHWSVDFSPDGRLLVVSGMREKMLTVWSSDGRQLASLPGATGTQFAHDSNLLVPAWWDPTDSLLIHSLADSGVTDTLTTGGTFVAELGAARRHLITRTRVEGPHTQVETWSTEAELEKEETVLEAWSLAAMPPKHLGRRLVRTPFMSGWVGWNYS
jgi:hypothetical protein